MCVSKKFGLKSALVLIVMVLSSCFSSKKITYFQKDGVQGDTVRLAEAYVPPIQVGDIMAIYINSLSTEASSFFNPYSGNSVPQDASGANSATSGFSQSSASGFLVDANGNITLPIVGEVQIKGLTIIEAQNFIKKRVEIYLKDPTVSVRFLNYRISILGEVNKPGVYVIPNESATIPEAISIAGDLTNYAKRGEIEIIRNSNGKKEFGEVSLIGRNVFSSKYYYLHANDIIYVKAEKSKVAQTDLTLRLLPLLLSALSLIIVLVK